MAGNISDNHSPDIREQLDKFRLHYKKKYHVVLDDEVLYIMIRVNELHVDLKKDIKKTQKVQFKSAWDYFLYGLGNFVNGLVVAAILVIIYQLFFNN